MEDEAVDTERFKVHRYEIFLPGETASIFCHYNEMFPPMIDYDEKEAEKPDSPVSKLRKIFNNREQQKDKILVLWHQKDNVDLSPPQPEQVSATYLYNFMGDFVVRDLKGLIKFHSSIDDVLDDIAGIPKYVN